MLNPFANRKLLRRGETARARIVEMSTPEHGAEPSKVSMTLEVDFRGAGPYEVRDHYMVPGAEPIGAGSDIWVAVDPEKRHRVAIDWERTRADYRERTDVRRRMLSAGIPVPVTKIRDALEEARGLSSAAAEGVAKDGAGEQADVEPITEAPAEPAAEERLAPAPVTGGGAIAPPAAADPFAGLSLHERDLLSHDSPAPLAPPVPSPLRRPRAPAPTSVTSGEYRGAPSTQAAIGSEASDEDGLTSKLERLAALNAAGALTDGEFSAAKAHVLARG